MAEIDVTTLPLEELNDLLTDVTEDANTYSPTAYPQGWTLIE